MSWLRLDDGFAYHPKIGRLSIADRWTWLEVLLFCARYRTGGVVDPAAVRSGVRGATARFLRRAVELELLDEYDDGALEVHDWHAYNGSIESEENRKRRYRMRKAGVAEAVVLDRAPYAELAQTDDLPLDRYVPGDVLRDVPGDDLSYARGPVPSLERSTGPTVVEGSTWAASLNRGQRVLWESLTADERVAVVQAHKASTGARVVRGSHGIGVKLDPLGTDRVTREEAPPGYDGQARRGDYLEAWCNRRAERNASTVPPGSRPEQG